MDDYIEREAVFLEMDSCDYLCDVQIENGKTLLFYDSLAENVKSIPAADVRPVVRGEWVDAVQGCGDSPHVRCSNCNEYYWRYFSKFRFCPNCGADMQTPEKEE